jgi:hypothetical protein
MVKLKNLQNLRKGEKSKHRYAYEDEVIDQKIDDSLFNKYF